MISKNGTVYFKLLVIATIGLYGCGNSKEKQVVAEVGDEKVYLHEVDKLIRNSLYEYLFAIFDARRIATGELVGAKLIAMEALKYRISTDSLIALETLKFKKKVTKSQYIMTNALQNGVIDEKNPFKILPLDSKEGKKVLEESYLKFLKVQLVNELKLKYNVKILLEQPKVPKINLAGVVKHTRGKVDSRNSLTIVADFSCPICRAKWPIFNGIFEKYKDRMRFEYISLAPSNSFSILFAECASQQGKFWQAHDLMFEPNVVVADSFFIDKLISELKLDERECMNCIRSIDHTKRIYTSMEKLRSQGIEVTPTILINDRIFYGDIGNESLSRFIDDVLTQSRKSGISHN